MSFPNLENKNRESRKLAKAIGKHWDVLLQLYEGEKYADLLAKALGKKLPAISKATKELIDSGLVKVRFSPQTKGAPRKYYSLTEKGRAIVEVILHGKIPEREEYTEAEVKMLVAHARNLKHSINYILKPYPFREREYDVEEAERWMPNLLSHLKEGYSDTYKLYEDCEKLKHRREEKERSIKQRIKSRVEEEFRDMSPEPGNFAEVITKNLEFLLKGYKLSLTEDRYWEFKNGEVRFGGLLLLKGKEEDLRRIKEFVFKSLKELEGEYKEVIELDNKYYEKRKELEKHLEEILKQIDSEIPLSGRCDTCRHLPKVRSD